MEHGDMRSWQPLSRAFYARPTLDVARALVGMTLLCATAEGLAGGIIVETEGYVAAIDPAAHGYRGMTQRNRTMFGPAGHAYVYQSYGIHVCMNVVTEETGTASAVLIRALEPTVGLDLMRARRGPGRRDRDLARGPGRLCAAIGITLADDGVDVTTGTRLWIAATPDYPPHSPIATTRRVGITRGAELPWRFVLVGSSYVSAGRVKAE